MKKFVCCISLLFLTAACSSKSSSKEEAPRMELSLQEIGKRLDDLRYDLNCFQVELQALDEKFSKQESGSLKQQYIEKQEVKVDFLTQQLALLESKFVNLEKTQKNASGDLHSLSGHANEASSALTQCKDRIREIEKELLKQSSRYEEIVKLKGTLETIAKNLKIKPPVASYRVKSGDSLEKIAKAHKISVDELKRLNKLDKDLIVVDQELKVVP